MRVPYTFRELLDPLEKGREGCRIADLSRQVKIEKFLLAEIMLNGNKPSSKLDFCLEDNRRDLIVREKLPREDGSLVNWVEAKMCYTGCLARGLTKTREGSEFEYREMLRRDALKQLRGIETLSGTNPSPMLTSILLAVHHDAPVRRQKYYPGFSNPTRHGKHSPRHIEKAAFKHVHEVIEDAMEKEFKRNIVEEFAIELCKGTRLHVFVFR